MRCPVGIQVQSSGYKDLELRRKIVDGDINLRVICNRWQCYDVAGWDYIESVLIEKRLIPKELKHLTVG